MDAHKDAVNLIADKIMELGAKDLFGESLLPQAVAILLDFAKLQRIEGFKAGQEAMRERAAVICDTKQETFTSRDNTYLLDDKINGALNGKAYANGIRALPIEEPQS